MLSSCPPGEIFFDLSFRLCVKQPGGLHLDMLAVPHHTYVITCGRLLDLWSKRTIRNRCLTFCCQAGIIRSGCHGHFRWLHHCFFLWGHHRGPVSPVMLLLVWALLPGVCSPSLDCCELKTVFGNSALFYRFRSTDLLIHVLFSLLIASLPTGTGWPARTSCLRSPTLCMTSTQCSCATGTSCRSKGTRTRRPHPNTWPRHWPATCVASSSWCCITLSWSPSASPSLW